MIAQQNVVVYIEEYKRTNDLEKYQEIPNEMELKQLQIWDRLFDEIEINNDDSISK